MMTILQDRVVVIMGAAGGMGTAIAAMLAREGAMLALADVNGEWLAQTVAEIGAVEEAVLAVPVDVTDEAGVRDFFAQVDARFGGVQVLINLPGVSVAARIDAMSLDDYNRIIDLNIKSAFLSAKHFIPLARDGGQILYASSMAARRANANAPVYCAAKAAVSMLAEGLALQVKDQNIRVTALRPGPTDTRGFWGDRPVPRETFMTTGDIAEVVRFILTLPPHIVVHEIAFESFDFFKR